MESTYQNQTTKQATNHSLTEANQLKQIELDSTSGHQRFPFEFTGNASEYFRIWIVNLVLTICTLGIYSAWAKVRTKRYFYRNIHVAGSAFEYHATPIQILKGRLLVVVIYAIYMILSAYLPLIASAIALVVWLLIPWLIVKAHLFNTRNSSWRNIRFDFNKNSVGESFRVFLFFPILIPFTLGLIIPYLSFRGWQFSATNTRVGILPFGFQAKIGKFYNAFFRSLLLFVAFLSIFFAGTPILSGMMESLKQQPQLTELFGLLLMFLPAIIYFVAFTYYRALTWNIALSGATLDAHQLESTLKPLEFAWMYVVNTVAIIISAGLLIPWAKVRVARYQAEHLFLYAADDLSQFEQAASQQSNALGEESSSFLDVDIGGI